MLPFEVKEIENFNLYFPPQFYEMIRFFFTPDARFKMLYLNCD